MSAAPRPLLIVGCGFLGAALCRMGVTSGMTVRATTRRPSRVDELSALGVEPVVLGSATELRNLVRGHDVIVTYPPDTELDAALSEACETVCSRAVYISSTAVYGATRGLINDETPVASDSEAGDARLRAEAAFRSAGAVVLRAPGIYGPGRGVHKRLLSGTFKLTGTGDNHLSRIQVEDLAGLSLAALDRAAAGSVFVVGDLHPCPQRELVEYLCQRLSLPAPPSQPVESAHRTLRGDRKVDPQRALSELGYRLRFPDYRSGFEDALRREAAVANAGTQ